MPLDELILLLPCHGAEDFPLDADGDTAETLRASWSALWHPALIQAAGAPPSMASAYDLPHNVENRVIVVPEICHDSLPEDWLEESRQAGAFVFDAIQDRQALSTAALSAARIEPPPLDAELPLDPELIEDFYALGYSQLHIELVTQHLYYTSELDDTDFSEHVVAAAEKAVAGDRSGACEKIIAAFDALAEARDRFHPLDAHLLDVVLVASTTLGQALRDELAQVSTVPINLLIAPELIEQLAVEQPATLAMLREALQSEKACVIGGVSEDQRLSLMNPEQILAHLGWALGVYEKHLGMRPRVFGCRTFAMTPMLPQILKQLGYTGVWHVSLDGRILPQTGQSKVQWQGSDHTAIDALLQMPANAIELTGYLKYVQNVSHTMGMDYVATQVFARWPGQSSQWYADLRRVSRYSPVLGKFESCDAYFSDTDVPGDATFFEPDEYRPDDLTLSHKQNSKNPISTAVQRQAAQLAGAHEQSIKALLQLSSETSTTTGDGLTVTNPNSRSDTLLVDVSALDRLPAVDDTVLAAAEQNGHKLAAVRVPALSSVRIASGTSQPSKTGKLLADERTLRNEFMEVVIGQHTGAIEKIHDYRTRGNRLGQQLAFRFAKPQRHTGGSSAFGSQSEYYSVMAADKVEITNNGEVFSEIVASGRLLDLEGRVLSRFVQKYQLWRGSRTLHIDVQLEPLHEPEAGPWESYYAMRFAWPDAAADIRRSLNMATFTTSAKRIESPNFVELCTPKWRTGIFSGETCCYRPVGMRMLDALLLVHGEANHSFHFGIGIDEPRPLPAALSAIANADAKHPPCSNTTSIARACSAESPAATLDSPLQIAPKNVIVTHIETIVENGCISGCRLRLLEIEGRGGTTHIRFARPLKHAEHQNLAGEMQKLLEFSDHQLSLEMSGHQWVQLEVRFAT